MPRTAWNKKLTPEMEQLIITRYQEGLTAQQVLQYIPFKTRKTVYDVLEKYAIPKRSPRGRADYKSYNEAAFTCINTSEQAYWLGILLTDGYICDTRKNSEPQVGLQMVDAELLEKFRGFLGSDRPVLRIEERSPHLLRGILDGDGTVSHRSDGGTIIGYCGTERLIAEIRIWLIAKLGISDNRLHKNESISFIQWSHDKDIVKIVRYLYQEAEIYLERKFSLIKRYL